MIELNLPKLHKVTPDLNYPVLIWTKSCDQVFKMDGLGDITIWPGIRRRRSQALAGEWSLVDATGAKHQILDFIPVEPRWGILGYILAAVGVRFAVPKLSDAQMLDFSELRSLLRRVAKRHLRYNPDFNASTAIKIETAETVRQTIDAFGRNPRV